MSLQLLTAPTDVVRDGHFERLSGLDTRALLLERAATNLLLRSEAFDNAAWTSTAVVTADATTAPDGNATADNLNDNSGVANLYLSQAVTIVNDSQPCTLSVWLKQNTGQFPAIGVQLSGGTGVAGGVVADLTAGTIINAGSGLGAPTASSITAFANGWYRISVTVTNNSTGNTTATALIYPAWASSQTATADVAATGAVFAFGAQMEVLGAATSYIATTSATATRSADSIYFPFPFTPQAMTVYLKFVERGATLVNGAVVPFSISSGATATPRFYAITAGGKYSVAYEPSASFRQATAVAAPSVGDLVELRAVLNADGSVTLGQTINSGTEANVTSAGGALALVAAWSDTRFYLNSLGSSNPGIGSYLAVKAMRGVQTLATMRAA